MSALIKQLSVNFLFIFPVNKAHPSRQALGPAAVGACGSAARRRGADLRWSRQGVLCSQSAFPLGLTSARRIILLYTNVKVLKRKIPSPGKIIT